MPKFIDTHRLGPAPERQLNEAQNAPRDEFGVAHENIIFSEKYNKLFCLLDAPSKGAVERHHCKLGVKPGWIHEVKTTK